MRSREDEKLQRGLIITDDVSIDPILGINYYKKVIIDIIKKSYPKFSIGIHGEWGTGKTTLMKLIFEELEKELKNKNNNSIVPVWFNAWRYERENQFALFPLLQTISNSIPKGDTKKGKVKEAVSKFATGFSKGLIKSVPEIVSAVLPSVVSEPLKITTDNVIDKVSKEFIPMIDKISQRVIEETVYSNEIENIETTIAKVREEEDFKIVVFIDDLDRCSPNKALEVLESIKVFLDLNGFIFVMGLSHDKITQLITAYYKEKDKEIGIEGDQYLKKIIQIPINLPLWNTNDIVELVNYFVDNGIIKKENHKIIIKNNIPLISTAIENNPRDIKRFLNNFIIAFEIFSKVNAENPTVMEEFDEKILLIIQAIQLRWNIFYNLLMNSDDEMREKIFTEINKNKSLSREKILQILGSKKRIRNINYDIQIINLLQDSEVGIKLWNFLSENIDSLIKVKDWNIYRRAIEITSDSASLKDYITIDSTPLLDTKGKVFTIPSHISEVDEFLSIIYRTFPKKSIGIFTYGEEWVLVDETSGKVFDDIGSPTSHMKKKKIPIGGAPTIPKRLEGYQSPKLNDVGIKSGMRLYVTKPE